MRSVLDSSVHDHAHIPISLFNVHISLPIPAIIAADSDIFYTGSPLPDIPIPAISAADTDIYYLLWQCTIWLLKIPMPDTPLPAINAAGSDICHR